MRTATSSRTEQAGRVGAQAADDRRLVSTARKASEWLQRQLAPAREPARKRRAWLALACFTIFFLALSVRLFHWEDSYAEIEMNGPWVSDIARGYKREAQRMLNEGRLLYPQGEVDPGDARLVLHPPGYSILMAGVFKLWGDSASAMRLMQIILDAISAVVVMLVAAQLFPLAVGIVAAALVALSPHLAHYSLWFSPDTLPVLPLLVAVYLIVRASERPRLVTVMGAGAMLGLSLWLRANALLLAPFLAAVIMLLTIKGRRLAYAAAFVGATVLVVSPITIRNWVLFHRFIPVSVAGGENLLVGIADVDTEGRFGMPVSDLDAALKDAAWYDRPDYADSAWFPDGIERDQARYRRGLQFIRSHPGWFIKAMLKRAAFMLKYNDSSSGEWPFNTSKVPIVSAEPPPLHPPASAGSQPAWSAPATGLVAEDSVVSGGAGVKATGDLQTLEIVGDGSEFGDQFASALTPVKPGTDYLLVIHSTVERGPVAVKVTSPDRRITLASAILGVEEEEAPKKKKSGDDAPADPASPVRMRETRMMFATGARDGVRLVVSNNGYVPARPAIQIGQVEMFDLGDTYYRWAFYPRALFRGLQKNLFKTGTMLPIVVAGLLLLAVAARGRALATLLAVPVYYLCAQSALSTEYRYILAIHYFLFILAGVTLFCAGRLVKHGARFFMGKVSR